ncbi:MAG: hypothetical protein WCD89_24040 [Anaerocolumna sp.]
MDAKDIIISDDMSFLILNCEIKKLYQPDIFGISPIWENDQFFEYNSIFEIKEYQLYLKSFTITADRGYPAINGIKPELLFSEKGIETVQYSDVMVPIKFTGAAVIGNTMIKNYGFDEIPCYSYKVVRELIFQDGKVVTTIDHSKAMLRIRKNLDLGLRTLNKTRDIKCIKYYIKSSFVGDYEHPEKINKSKKNKKIQFNSYLQKIKSYYSRIKAL